MADVWSSNWTRSQAEDSGVPSDEVAGWFSVLEVGCLGALLVVMVASSVAVVTVVLSCSRLHTIPGYLMVALGVCHVAIAGTVLLPTLVVGAGGWEPDGLVCDMQVLCTNYLFSLESGIIMLCAVDRCLAIARPLTYTTRATFIPAFSLLFVSICAADLVLPLTITAVSESSVYQHSVDTCVPRPKASAAPYLHLLVLLGYLVQFVVPGLVMMGCYSFIGYKAIRAKLQRQRRLQRQLVFSVATNANAPVQPAAVAATVGSSGEVQLHQLQGGETSSLVSVVKQLRLCKMLVIISVVYFLAFLPLSVYQYLVFHAVIQHNKYLMKLLNLLQYSNGAIHGLLFYNMSNTFQEQVRSIVHVIMCAASRRRRHSMTSLSSMRRVGGGGGGRCVLTLRPPAGDGQRDQPDAPASSSFHIISKC